MVHLDCIRSLTKSGMASHLEANLYYVLWEYNGPTVGGRKTIYCH